MNPLSSSAVLFLVAAAACSSERPPATAPSVRSCQGVGSAEPHQVLLNRQNVESVEVIKDAPFVARASPLKAAAAERKAKIIGARILVHPAVGLTAERLALLANCDQLSAQQSPIVAHDSSCPFAVRGASTTVNSTGIGFALDVVGDSPAAAQEIVRRASSLKDGANP